MLKIHKSCNQQQSLTKSVQQKIHNSIAHSSTPWVKCQSYFAQHIYI